MSPEEKFAAYVQHYNPQDSQIRLKIVHTMKVVTIADALAAALALDEEHAKEVHMAALFHDIGRFEQVRRFHTFNDARSVPHAALGVEILDDGDFLEDLPEEAQSRVKTAIAVHSDFAIPESQSGWQRELSKILRDADKIDILRVSFQENSKDTIDLSLVEQDNPGISPAVEAAILENRSVLRADRHTLLDFWISFLGFLFDLNYPASFAMVKEQGFWSLPLTTWLEEHPNADVNVRNKVQAILDHCTEYIEEHLLQAESGKDKV